MRPRSNGWPLDVSPVHVRRSAYLGEGSNAGEASTSEAGVHLEALRQKRHGPSRYFSERAGTFAESLAGESTGVRLLQLHETVQQITSGKECQKEFQILQLCPTMGMQRPLWMLCMTRVFLHSHVLLIVIGL